MKLILLMLFVIIIKAQIKDCPDKQAHTGAYYELMSNKNNYVQFNTWGGSLSQNVLCQDMTPNYFLAYISLLNASGIGCQGNLCVDGKFICRPGDIRGCYGIQHIILEGSLNPYCNLNVATNFVISWKYWNLLMEIELCMRDINAEKMEVLGQNLYCATARQFKACNDPLCNFQVPEICKIPPAKGMSAGGAVALVVLIMAAILFIGTAIYLNRYRIKAFISNYTII